MMIVSVPAAACAAGPAGNSTMVDPDATAATRALWVRLKTITKTGTMFGHQDDTAYGIGWKYESGRSDVRSVCGDFPAVYGWEIGGIELGGESSLDSIRFDMIRSLASEARARGGVNTISWHPRNPVTGGDTWDTTGGRVVETILPGGSNHAMFTVWLDRVAALLGSFRDQAGDPVPVIFRPWHEHTGSWFWWGRDFCSPAEYTALWRFTVEYLRDTKGLHNIVYCYSPDRVSGQAEYLECYPGDEWVDLLGLDLYHHGGAEGTAEYRRALDASLGVVAGVSGRTGKPFALTETGLEGVTIDDWFTGVLAPLVESHAPAYVLVWRNAYERPGHFYAPYPGHPACDDFAAFCRRSGILTNSRLPEMYK